MMGEDYGVTFDDGIRVLMNADYSDDEFSQLHLLYSWVLMLITARLNTEYLYRSGCLDSGLL